MKMYCFYERVPEVPFLVFSKKGKPKQGLLYPYSKNYGFKEFGLDTRPHTRGGATTVYLLEDDSSWMLSGRTVCSMSDNFSYKVGREKALLRATNLGLGHDNLDSGLMFRLEDKFSKWTDQEKADSIIQFLSIYVSKFPKFPIPNTAYFHPETALIITKNSGFNIKTSKIILKNHVWIGFEE